MRMIPRNEVYFDGELVHLVFFVDTEPVSYECAMKDSRWINPMKEELNSIEKIKHGS